MSNPNVMTKERPVPNGSVQDQLLRGYDGDSLSKELVPVKQDMDGDINDLDEPERVSTKEIVHIQEELGELATEAAGVVPPVPPTTITGIGAFGEQPALPPGRGGRPALPPGGEQKALPPGRGQEVTPITVGHIDLSHNAERKAYDLANRKIEEMKKENEARFLLHPKRILRNIWGYNYTHRKALTEARDAIRSAQDVNIGDEDFSDDMRKRYGEAIFDQFFNGPEEAIDNAAGEHREFFENDHEATVATRELYAQFAQAGTTERPAMTDDEFNAAIKKIRSEHIDGHRSDTATGEVEQDNYLEAARAMRGRIEQGEAIDDVLEGFRLLKRAESRADARTDVHKTKLDNILDKYEKSRLGESRFGSLVSSTALAAGASLAAFGITRGMTSTAQALAFFGGSAVIGATAGAREYRDITKQRAAMGRERFHGKDYSQDQTDRQIELSKFEYENVSVDKTLENLDNHIEKLQSGDLSTDDLKAAFDELATIRVLKKLSATRNIDLFDHGKSDDPNKHITDRTALAVKQAELTVILGGLIDSGNPEALKLFELADATPEAAVAGKLTSGKIEDKVNFLLEEKTKAIDEKDAAFRAYRRKEAIWKGAKVAGFSLVAGLAIQEAYASLSSGRSGLVEQVWGGNDSPGAHETALGTLMPDQEAKVEHIHTELSKQQVDDLRADLESKGGSLTENHTTMYRTVTEQMTQAEYAKNNPGEMRHFENVKLFDNNTSQIDMNELGGQLAKNPDGSFRPWESMTRDGSLGGNERINMTDRSNNVFTIAFKQPDGTHVFKVFEYGQDVGEPYSDMLRQNADGTVDFTGNGYIAWGQSADNTLNVAASKEGLGGSNIFTAEKRIAELQRDYRLETPAENARTVWPGAISALGASRLGVANRPSNGQEPTVPKPELPPVTEPTAERPPAEIESAQRRLAREADWPLISLQIDGNLKATTEQWKMASLLVKRYMDVNKNVMNPLDMLKGAMTLAEQEGASPEIRGLLSALDKINNLGDDPRWARSSRSTNDARGRRLHSQPRDTTVKQRETAQRSDARSFNEKAAPENMNKAPDTPPTPEVISARTESLNTRLTAMTKIVDARDGKLAIEKANISPEMLARARDIFIEVIAEYGDIDDKALARRVATKVHPDINSGVDSDLVSAVNWIGEHLKRGAS